jgi:hypothetical protein
MFIKLLDSSFYSKTLQNNYILFNGWCLPNNIRVHILVFNYNSKLFF